MYLVSSLCNTFNRNSTKLYLFKTISSLPPRLSLVFALITAIKDEIGKFLFVFVGGHMEEAESTHAQNLFSEHSSDSRPDAASRLPDLFTCGKNVWCAELWLFIFKCEFLFLIYQHGLRHSFHFLANKNYTFKALSAEYNIKTEKIRN